MQAVRNTIGGLGNLLFKEAYILGQVFDGKLPDEYVQSEKYWVKHKDRIKARFAVGVGKSPFVAIHVRRGDYVGNTFYVDLTETDYYEEAMKQFPSGKFKVFSDDIFWCMRQSIFEGCVFSTGKTELQDFNDMASCQGHITANSSYGWWAAYVSPHGGKVVAPKAWHPDKIQRTELPSHWIKI